jgi:CHRD domain
MRQRRIQLAAGVAVVAIVSVVATTALAGHGGSSRTELHGFEEVPAIVTDGEGKFTLKINRGERRLDYTLTYSGLEGGNVRFAHIHIGQFTANGDVVTFLCGGGAKPAPCPASGTVTGTITPADLQPADATPQGIDGPTPEEFDDFVRAIRAGMTYANVHTDRYLGGEVRGQIDGDGGDDD